MEHYPDIQRREGTLFFACPEDDRAAIATSIERLIDLLDTMDGDPDLEPVYGWPNAGQRTTCDMACDDEREQDNADWEPSLGSPRNHGSQARWAEGSHDEREDDGDDREPDESGYGDVEGMEEDMHGEPSLGWREILDQSAPHVHHFNGVEDGEPELGWCGHGTGWSAGEEVDDREGDDEREWDGLSPRCDIGLAEDMIRGLPMAARRADAYSAITVARVYVRQP